MNISDRDDRDDRTFYVNFTDDGAARLRERLRERLKEFMGDYTDNTLVHGNKRTGAVTIRVSGVLKDWILIALSTIVFPESIITVLNIIGYAIALCGVVMYNYLKAKDVRVSNQLPVDGISCRLLKEVKLAKKSSDLYRDDDIDNGDLPHQEPVARAGKIMSDNAFRANNVKRMGSIPGVEVGDIFYYRTEVLLVGLLAQSVGGIDYMNVKFDNEVDSVAICIVSAGGHENKEGLVVFASGFANDFSFSYNYSSESNLPGHSNRMNKRSKSFKSPSHSPSVSCASLNSSASVIDDLNATNSSLLTQETPKVDEAVKRKRS